MNSTSRELELTRRHFMRNSVCSAMGITGVVNTLSQLRLMNAALAQGGGGGYKALVCLYLGGGNDSNNMIFPTNGALRTEYENGRGVLAIPTGTEATITPDNDPGGWGLHPQMADLAGIFNAGDLAVVNNVGTLVYPIPGRNEYINNLVPRPGQLFSHSDQTVQWQSSMADNPGAGGWGGRAADLLHASYNPDSKVSMLITLNGINRFQVGTSGTVVQYAMNSGGTIELSGYGNDYTSAVNPDSSYKTNDQGKQLKAFETIMRMTHDNLLEDEYTKVMASARDNEAIVGSAIDIADASGVDFDTIFAGATNSPGNQLKMIAKMIAGRSALDNDRQIFFVSTGGFDNHQTMLAAHDSRMNEVNTGLKAFYDAMVAMGDNDKVVTFTASDFNRTFTPNGTDPLSSGSDHAWGGSSFVMGGPVNGKNLYGAFPDLVVGGNLDAHNTRGRWIPTTSVDQFAAVLTDWLGANSSSIEAIFPNLSRFDDPFGATANLGFL